MKSWKEAEGARDFGLLTPPIVINTDKTDKPDGKQPARVKLLPDWFKEQEPVEKEAESRDGDVRVIGDGKVRII